MKAFKKNEAVTYIASWDSKGTFYYSQAVVVSCGAKQMTLQHAETGAMMGRNFEPAAGSLGVQHHFRGTHKGMTDAKAEAKCLELAAEFIEYERARYADLIEKNADNAGYCAAMRKGLDELHEPRVLKR